MRTKLMALEAIHYQKDTSFFKELTEILTTIRNSVATLGQMQLVEFYQAAEVQAITHCIRKHTNLNLKLKGPDSNCGPAVDSPAITKNHAFDLMWEYPVGQANPYDSKSLDYFEKTKEASKIVLGTVDIRTSRVGGLFAEQSILLCLPSQYLLGVGVWKVMEMTAEEMAAILLHEVGHVFTYYEYLDRVVTTNQVLASIAHANTNKDLESKKIIISRSARDLTIAPDDITRLLESEDNLLAAVILVQTAKQQCISELGISVYDQVGCEQLADQYANRMGAGRAVVTGLDKIIRHYGPRPHYFPIRFILNILDTVCATFDVISFFLNLLCANFVSDKYLTIYDDDKTRYLRIKHDMVNQLKNPLVVGAQRDQILSDLAAIDVVIDRTDPAVLSIVNKLTYFFSSSRKKVYESTILQKELEEFANSNLYAHAAKLQQILKSS